MTAAGSSARRAAPIPVTVTASGTEAAFMAGPDVALVRLEAPLHDHGDATACVACESRGDVRLALFELGEKVKRGMIPAFTSVVVDASAVPDIDKVRDAIVPGKLPAQGLRDHTVARTFRLAE